jgi:hypothetical protein
MLGFTSRSHMASIARRVSFAGYPRRNGTQAEAFLPLHACHHTIASTPEIGYRAIAR